MHAAVSKKEVYIGKGFHRVLRLCIKIGAAVDIDTRRSLSRQCSAATAGLFCPHALHLGSLLSPQDAGATGPVVLVICPRLTVGSRLSGSSPHTPAVAVRASVVGPHQASAPRYLTSSALISESNLQSNGN